MVTGSVDSSYSSLLLVIRHWASCWIDVWQQVVVQCHLSCFEFACVLVVHFVSRDSGAPRRHVVHLPSLCVVIIAFSLWLGRSKG
jgi:hypothetical protein